MDSISRLVTTLKNAARAKRASAALPYSAFSECVLRELAKAGYLSKVSVRGEKHRRELEIALKYNDGVPAFTEVKRLSKPSRRLYRQVSELRAVRHGYGKLFLTTPKGILTGEAARKAKVGGEPLFQIW